MQAIRALALAICVSMLTGVAAAPFPTKPVRLVVPYPPGGSTDVAARLIAQKLSEVWAQTVVVDNRPGAGTNIGTEIVVRAPPDGYTLLMGSFGNAVAKSLFPALGFDPQTDLAPIAQLSRNAVIMTVPSNSPAQDVRGFIEMAKAKPGQLNYGAGGAGSSAHLAAEMLKQQAGVDLVSVVYKGGAAALQDLLRADVHVLFDSPQTIMPQLAAGKVRVLAVTGRARSPALPQVPTLQEAGLPNFELYAWFGILAPAKTPREVIGLIESACAKVVADPQIQARFAVLGIEPVSTGAEAFARFFRAENAKWGEVVRRANIKLE